MNRPFQWAKKPRITSALLAAALVFALLLAAGCSGGGANVGGGGAASSGTATGAAFNPPQKLVLPVAEKAPEGGMLISTEHVSEGYVTASAYSGSRLKFQVTKGEGTYNYDLPGDGTPIVCPINMGNGSYLFRIMQNTSGSNYVEVSSKQAAVNLVTEFAPYTIPNVYCKYDESSACVATAREITANAENVGEVVKDVCTYLVENVKYDNDKARALSETTGYVPDPDSTLSAKSGICFDYASLAAAMLRSLGIPTQIVTGYVGPNDLYHAWIQVYIDGSWQSTQFSVDPNTWSRVDVTFAAAGSNEFTGDASYYTDRYVY